jgi:hypothetical protein
MKKTGERISVSEKRQLIGREFSIRGTWIDRFPKKEYDSFELINFSRREGDRITVT